MVCNESKSANKIQKYPHSQNLRSLGPKLDILEFLPIIWKNTAILVTNITRMVWTGTKSVNKIQKSPQRKNLRPL